MAAANSKTSKAFSFIKNCQNRSRSRSVAFLLFTCLIIAGYVFIRYGEMVRICEEEHLSRTSQNLNQFSFMEIFYQVFHWFKAAKANKIKETSSLCSETWLHIIYVIFTEKFVEDTRKVVQNIIAFFLKTFRFFFVYMQTVFHEIQISLHFYDYSLIIICFAVLIVIAFILVIFWKLLCLKRNSSMTAFTNHVSENKSSSKQFHPWLHESCDSLQLTPVASNGRLASTSSYVRPSQRPFLQCSCLMRGTFLLVLMAAILSIPWEFLRLYQKAVASRATHVVKGLPPQCSQVSMGLLESFQFLLRWHFSWSHSHDICQDYYYASFVDPLWEVNPLIVLSSVFTHSLLHPLEIASSSLGRSMRAFFSEIPTQWQPLVMLVAMVMSLILLLMTCRYRLLIPLFLRIEPQTPVTSPAERERLRCEKDVRYRDFLDSKNLALKYDPARAHIEERDLSHRLHQMMPNFHQVSPTSNHHVSSCGDVKETYNNLDDRKNSVQYCFFKTKYCHRQKD